MSTQRMSAEAPIPHHRYRHYKGNEYEVVGVALQTETRIPLVVYKPLYPCEFNLFARPLAMFMESVTVDGEKVSRFTHIGPMQN